MKKLRVLMYNNIGTYPEAAMEDAMSAKAFARDMDFLATHGYQVVSLDEAMQRAMERRRLPDRLVALTFDGGYRDLLETVVPALDKHHFPATFFISPHHIGGSLTVGGVDIPCMNQDEISRLTEAGHEIGAYALSGRIYQPQNSTMEKQLIEDIRLAAHTFPSLLARPLRFVSVREGIPGSRVIEALKDAGVEGFFTKCPTKRRPNRYCMGRIQIDDDDPNIFLIKISRNYLRFKDSRSWRYLRKYKVDRLAHMISDHVNARRQKKQAGR
ncbi:MAG: polysaccharide deacetylase family protein [Mariprofundaceae bacterium]|nr:polysaccharide deacetylase family protein [Mariprofundaceae bacterium]